MSEKLRLVKTCEACPEQYDVYLGDKRIAYMRLRHGFFRVEYPFDGEVIYSTSAFDGDGMFTNDAERRLHLNMACEAILNKHHGQPSRFSEDLFTIEYPEDKR